MSSTEREAIAAALLWDRMALRRSRVRGTDEFVDVWLPSGVSREIPEPETSEPLLLAAAAIMAQRSDQSEEALRLFGRIHGDQMRDLFRLTLLAWSPVTDVPCAESALNLLSRMDVTDEFRARIARKLFVLAADSGEKEVATEALRLALSWASPGTRLHLDLALEVQSLLGERVELGSGRIADLPDDPLVSPAWIDGMALNGAQALLSEQVVDRASNPWSKTVRVGQRPLDEVVAAELQATWAGAIGQRRSLRRQLAGHLLTSGTPSPEQALAAAFYWFDSGGQSHSSMAEFVEPYLPDDGADRLIGWLAARFGPPEGVRYTLSRVARGLWDCLSDEAFWKVLDQLPPSHRDDLFSEASDELWGLAALRDAGMLAAKIRGLDDAQRATVASQVAALDEQLSDVARAELADVISLVPEAGEEPVMTLHAAVGKTVKAGATRNPREIRSLLSQLIAVAEKSLTEPSGGNGATGGSELWPSIGRVALLLDGDRRAEEVLIAAAEATNLPVYWRVQALNALAHIGIEDALSSVGRAQLRSIELRPTGDDFFQLSSDTLEAARLMAIARGLTERDLPRVLALSRSVEAEARQLAVNAAALAPAPDATASGYDVVLFNALFDPQESVVQTAISGIARWRDLSPEFEAAVVQRLVNLFDLRGRDVRAAATLAVRRLGRETPVGEVRTALLERSRKDRSWIVRRAANLPLE